MSDSNGRPNVIDETGYMSEGGASIYARRIQSRIAMEKQKEVDRTCRPLPGLPDILGQDNQVYRVVGGRNKFVQKSDTSIQTETVSALNNGQTVTNQQNLVDWKQAMAHNARVLSSQEKAMDEYLRRQRAAAEQHIAAANNQVNIEK